MDRFFMRLETLQNHPFLLRGEETFSYGALWRAVVNTSVLLKKSGVGPGERIPLLFGASPEYLTALLAVFAVGACAAPLNLKMTGDELREICKNLGARIVLTTTLHRERFEALGKDLLELDWDSLSRENNGGANSNAVFFAPEIQKPESEALILFSSGSSGKPKGVIRSRRAVLIQMETLSHSFNYKVDDLMVCAAWPQHSYGLENILAALYGGASIYFLEEFDYNRAWKMLEDTRCTIFVGVPLIYEVLVKLKRSRKNDHRPRLALSAGAPLLEETNRAFDELFYIPVTQIYGSSEAPSSAVNLAVELHRQFAAVGQPLPGVEIRIVGEAGEILPSGVVGEIWIKSPFAAERYLDQPELTRENFQEGWFHTGDLGYWSEIGLLFLQGRKKNMINVAGNKVNPEEVEMVIRQFPGVREVKVEGVSDPVYGEMVKAILVTEGGSSINEIALLQHCQGKMADYKLPRFIEYSASLPRTATGKPRREK